jgi:ketosteroid isomerase-like protein
MLSASSSLETRLRAHLGLKLALALGLNLFAFVPYFWLQRNVFFPVTVMTESAFDAWLSFTPNAVWIYLSLFLLMPIAPMQMQSRRQLGRYALGVVAMSLSADLLFLFWPTTVIRPSNEAASRLYASLAIWDLPLNAFPSLHAAMAVYSALCCEQIFSQVRRPWMWRITIWPWVMAIVWAMLATKQHVALDAIGGIVLGATVYRSTFSHQTIARKQSWLNNLKRGGLYGMKGYRWWVGVVGFVIARATVGYAAEEADHEALRKIKADYEESVKSDDLSKLIPHLGGNMTAVTPTGEEVKGAQQLQSYFKSIWDLIGKGGTYQVKVNVTNTDLYGDIAVSYGTTDEFVKTAEGREYKFPMLWTAVARREDGGWKAIRMHGSMNPLSNVFVTTQLNATKWIYGGGGVLVGLIVGFLLSMLRRART